MTAIMQKSIGSLTHCGQGPDAFLGGGMGLIGPIRLIRPIGPIGPMGLIRLIGLMGPSLFYFSRALRAASISSLASAT